MIGGPLVAVVEAQTLAARATADFVKSVGFDKDNKPIYVEFKYPKETAPYQPEVPAHIGGVRVTAQGTGYDAATPPAVTFSAAGAEAKAVVEGGKVVRIDLLEAGEYTTAPTITIAAPTSGTAATAEITWVEAKDAREAKYTEMKIEVPILTILPIPFIRVEEATIDFNAKINAMETSSESTDLAIKGDLEVKQRWPGGSAKLNVSCSYQKKTASGSSVERTYSMHIYVKASQDEMPAGMEKLLSLLEGAMKATPVPEPKPA
jgi:hypothetical protein